MNNLEKSVPSNLGKRLRSVLSSTPTPTDSRVFGLRREASATILGLAGLLAGAATAQACVKEDPTENIVADNSSANIADGGYEGGDARLDGQSDAPGSLPKDSGKDGTIDSPADAPKDAPKDNNSNADAIATAEFCANSLKVWAQPNVFSQSKPTKLFYEITDVGSPYSVTARIEDEKVSTFAKIIKVVALNTPTEPGVYSTLWDGTDNAGNPLPGGNYIWTVAAVNAKCGPSGDEVVITKE